jgi:hypothetical protein
LRLELKQVILSHTGDRIDAAKARQNIPPPAASVTTETATWQEHPIACRSSENSSIQKVVQFFPFGAVTPKSRFTASGAGFREAASAIAAPRARP